MLIKENGNDVWKDVKVFWYDNEKVPIQLDSYNCEISTIDLSAGYHKVFAKAFDRAGNKSIVYSRSFLMGSNPWQHTVSLSDHLITQKGEVHCSPYQPIFNVGFANPVNESLQIQATFKAGMAILNDWSDIFQWQLRYNPQNNAITDSSPNTYTVYTIIKGIGADQKNLLQFDWNGLGRDGLHVYDEDIIIDVKVTDEVGNSVTDNSQHFKITPDGIVYDPNDPDRSKEKMIAKFRNNANKTFILGSPLSVGGTEFSNLKQLFGGFNIGFRSWNIFGDKKWGGVDGQIDSIKRQVEAFSANPADKVTMVAWGQAGVLAKEYIRKYLPTDKIAKLITVGTPLKGINSIPMAIQSHALNCLLTPVITFVDSLGLNEVFNNIQQRAGPYGPDLGFLSFLQQTSRNDLVLNPLNVIGLLLGRQDYAKNFQADSEFMRDLNQFSTTDIGIDHSSITTALWPDMDGGVQAGIVAGFTALGMAGAYTGMELFSLKSKTYNNINDEVANILVDLAMEEINRLTFNPIRNAINEAERNAIKQSFWPMWKEWIDAYLDANPGKSPQEVINAFVQQKVTGPIEQGTNVILGPVKQVQQYIEDPNGPIFKLNAFITNPIAGDIGNTLRKVIGEKATAEVNGLLSSVLLIAVPVSKIVDPNTGLAAEITAGINAFKTQLTTAITSDITNLSLEWNGGPIDEVNLSKEAEKLCARMDQYFMMPFEIINGVIDDFILKKIQVPLRTEMKKRVETLLPDFNKILELIPSLRVTIPGGVVGGAVVGAMAYLATDYLINTDGISEAHPLALSKLMGLSASQAADGGQNAEVKGWHWSGASAQDKIARMISQSAPQICGISLNGKPLDEWQVYPKSLPAQGLFVLTKDNQYKEIGKISMKEFFKSFKGKIIDNNTQFCTLRVSFNYEEYRTISLTNDGLFQLSYNEKEDGVAKPINLLDGVNTVIMEATNEYGGKSRQVFQIVLDMLAIQMAPVYPYFEEYISEQRSRKSGFIPPLRITIPGGLVGGVIMGVKK